MKLFSFIIINNLENKVKALSNNCINKINNLRTVIRSTSIKMFKMLNIIFILLAVFSLVAPIQSKSNVWFDRSDEFLQVVMCKKIKYM